MNKFISLIAVFFTVLILNAQKIPFSTNELRFDSETTEVPTFAVFEISEQPTLDEFEQIFAPYFKGKKGFSWKLKRTEKDELGFVHYFYRQTYRGNELEFSALNLHSKNGKIHSYNGVILNEVPQNNEISISEEEALTAAMKHIGAKVYKWELQEEEAFIKKHENNSEATYYPIAKLKYVSTNTELNASTLQLCYAFNIYAHEPMSRSEIYVSANDGSIVFKNDLIHTANSPGTAVTAYSGSQNITTDSFSSSQFRLRQTSSGGGVRTFDLNTSTSYGNAVDFTDSDNFWNNVNSNLDQYATDAHWGAEQTYDYFFSQHNRNSINNNGFALISYVHYGSNFANAFWNGQYMTYGDGGGGISPLTALDIAGHEIAHGLTTFSANLVYESESGALNESFSDIFGAAIEFYARPGNANWTIGEDIGSTIRSMSNPNNYNDPDTRGGTYWFNVNGCTPNQQNDNCGVHRNSGVQNYWFYLLSSGGSGVNDLNNSFSVNAIGIDKAAAIAFRNLTVYLGRNSDYDDARLYSIRSAIDLYGPCSPQVQAVTNAWYAVGVGPAYQAGVVADFEVQDSTACAPPHAVSFMNNSSNGVNFKWYFGDGDSSTLANPNHSYQNFGSYDVELQVDGGTCGTDTLVKSNYIFIDTAINCTDVLSDGFNSDQLGCNGRLFDSGGPNADYGNNQQGTLTIAPTNSTSITLNFLSFSIEAGSSTTCDYDYLEIYDGPNISSPLIGRYCNTTGSPGTITSSTGAITLVFFSDQFVTESGFEIAWSCTYPNSAPTANFSVGQDSSCTGIINFLDLSTEIPNQWYWDFGDGSNSNQQNPTHQYQSNGNYNVSLVASNSIGSDTLTLNNVINVQRPLAPNPIFDTVCIGEPSNLSTNVSGTAKWYTSESASNPIQQGSNFVTAPLLSDTSFWVENYSFANVQSVGVRSNSIGSGAYGSFDRHLIFDVIEPIILDSVTVFAASSGNRIVEVRNSAGTVLHSRSYYLQSGRSVLPLGFYLTAGTDYQIGLPSNGVKDLFRTNSGLNYPYEIPGKIRIKGSNATPSTSYYYYFYDWKIKEEDCFSARTEVKIAIDSTCSITALSNLNAKTELKLYPNPSKDIAYLESSEKIDAKEVKVYNLSGKVQNVKVERMSQNTLKLFSYQLPSGIYIVRVKLHGVIKQMKLSIIN